MIIGLWKAIVLLMRYVGLMLCVAIVQVGFEALVWVQSALWVAVWGRLGRSLAVVSGMVVVRQVAR